VEKAVNNLKKAVIGIVKAWKYFSY